MVARLLAVGLVAAGLFGAAPANQLTIDDKTSATQTNRPTSFGRAFKDGEIWNYPQPVVNGTPATSWQATVKTRHRDGLASCSVTGATNEYPITITCANHGYRNGDYVEITGVGGNTAANGRHRIVRRGRHTFFLQGATGNGTYTTGGTATGPGPGSVQFAIIVLDDDIDLSADGSLTITFQDSTNACHLGSEETCEAAALTEAEMLAWDSAGWGAEIEATQGNTYTANARTMVDAAAFEYYIAGPILTEIIVRDHAVTRTYDFGWTCLTNCTTDYSTATWSTDTTDKSLSPIFVLSFYDALPNSVKIEYILENVWYGHLQDQRYSLVLNSDSTGSTEEYTKAVFTHYARQRWRKVFWDGTEPGAININHNEAYWEYTGAIPVFADDISPGSADITDTNTDCAGGNFDIAGNGCFTKYFLAGGGRQELGLFPTWDSVWLQTFDYGVWSLVWNNGNVSGHIPIHIREASTDTTLYFVDVDADGSTDNDAGDNEAGNGVFGRLFSIDARPTLGAFGGTVATLSSSHGWTIDYAHQSAFGYTAYLATGEWYLLEEMQFWASFNVATTSYPAWDGCGRGKAWGIISQCFQTRGQGWAGRNVVRAAWASPDGTVEKEYLTNKLENNLMYQEGRFANHFRGEHYLPLIGQTDAAPCTGFSNGANWTAANPYCYGYYFGTEYGGFRHNPLGEPSHGANPGCDALTTATLCTAPWMQDYLIAGFYGIGKDLGFRTDGLLRMTAKSRLHYLDPRHSTWLTFDYRAPLVLNTTGKYAVSPAQHYADGYTATGKAKAAWDQSDTYYRMGYNFSFIHGSLPYLTEGRFGGVTWQDAWDWYTNESNVENINTRCVNGDVGVGCSTSVVETRFNVGPRFPATQLIRQTPGHTYSIWRYMAPTANSVCTINSNGDGLNGTGRIREYVLTGLTASTPYEHVLLCDDDPWGGETVSYTTTAAPAGTATLSVTVGQGDTTTYLDWGYTSALSETPDSIACTTGCNLAVAGVTKGLVYYRIRHADGRTGKMTTRNLQ